ncbi:MAG TPA: hypothetical protein VGS22_23310 [Thermoanaerobaculia bacterium]|jgi:triacylglycerol lipase|nr:hypothetical protein [Thermoanaerobaculia bacterium]
MSRGPIVLAHGVLGFGSIGIVPSFLTYFKGVADHLRGQGHTVFEPQVSPIGSVEQRGKKLASYVLEQVPGKERIHIIAHSMGGLDARFAITNVRGVAERVATLVTIGTPHRGSPVADAIKNRTDPLSSHVPPIIKMSLEHNVGALDDLTTDVGIHFDQSTPDHSDVRYVEVAGDASKGSDELLFFHFAAEIGRIKGEVNDGVVTRSSALRPNHEHLEDWPVDHAGEVGWHKLLASKSFKSKHLQRYEDIVNRLRDD